MREIVREWVKKGDRDYIAAKTIAKQKDSKTRQGSTVSKLLRNSKNEEKGKTNTWGGFK